LKNPFFARSGFDGNRCGAHAGDDLRKRIPHGHRRSHPDPADSRCLAGKLAIRPVAADSAPGTQVADGGPLVAPIFTIPDLAGARRQIRYASCLATAPRALRLAAETADDLLYGKSTMNDLFSLQGRVALVTGGSRGIGRMIAKGFIAQGARVYISSRKADVCEATARELSQGGGKCVALPVDVSTNEGVAALANAYLRHEPQLDILVNNAGAAWLAEFDAFPEKGWDKVVDLNLKAPFFLTQALHGALSKAARPDRPAKVINIASIDGVSVNPQDTYSYAASKSGLIHLTRRMAVRLAEDNIVVSAIAPGAFASDMNTLARDHADEVAKRIPIKRIGTDEDMAGAAIFLASRAGDYVVGTTLVVDGGVTYTRGWSSG
jgi:NAD(P)-dependent dehydrogenase (short-subunit alcohol dehydrogenase family)